MRFFRTSCVVLSVAVAVTGCGDNIKAAATAPPTITTLAPDTGPQAGGTMITISGTGFTGATEVDFGTTASPSFQLASDSAIIAVSPAGSGVVNVTVIGPAGTSNGGTFTYGALPTLSAITPSDGPSAGGTAVTLTGTGLTGTTAVTFGTVVATDITAVSDTEVTATAPAGTGTVVVSATTPLGTSNGEPFGYDDSPTLTSATPASGVTAGGTTVVLVGTNLAHVTAVAFGATAATSFTLVSDTMISAVSPAGTGSVDITATTPGGTSNGVAFAYIAAPTITALVPVIGSSAGGTTVTITGTGLTGTTGVTFGGTAGTALANVSDTQITIVAPAHAAGAVNVVVTTPFGSATATAGFTYLDAPTITTVVPNTGLVGGGTTVVITGTNFTTATAVAFGGTAAAAFTINSAISITATTPAHTVGAVNVTVTNGGGVATATNAFVYGNAPSITNVMPAIGLDTGGTTVTLTGANLTGTTSVTFGGVAGTSLHVANDTTVTVVTPVGTDGPVDVVVTTPIAATTVTAGFTYGGTPTITSVLPNVGNQAGGDLIVILGTHFTGATAVAFGGSFATFTVINDSKITATTATHGAGAVDVDVQTPFGLAVASNGFTYLLPPTVSAAIPAAGSTTGGDPVVITGRAFTGATSVTIGGVPVFRMTIVSDGEIDVITAPDATVGAADIVVTTPGGPGTLTAGFTLVAPPVVTTINPSFGALAGGDLVEIDGTGFTGATGVTFGGVAATINSVTDTVIMVTTPPGLTGAVDVVVTTPFGSGRLSGSFTYDPLPTIISLNPVTGPTAGGTLVTVTGTNLTNVQAVVVDGISVPVTPSSSTSLTFTTPVHAAGTVNVGVTGPDGGATLLSAFTYADLPTITSVLPPFGPTVGGTSVTIAGSGLLSANRVTFGGVAGIITGTTNTSLTVSTPLGASGVVDVVVTTVAGMVTSPGAYTYESVPALTTINPSTGFTIGGDTVQLNGAGFIGVQTVTFDGLAATLVAVVDDSTITCVTPPHAAGAVDVVVTNDEGSSTLTDGFTYTP